MPHPSASCAQEPALNEAEGVEVHGSVNCWEFRRPCRHCGILSLPRLLSLFDHQVPQSRPARWNHASTSASSRSVTGLFTGLYMPAHSSGRYRGRLLDPSEASILATFLGAFAGFVTRLRCFILHSLYVHKHGNIYTRTTFPVGHSALLASGLHLRSAAHPNDLP